jgi:hypothetical protein
MSQKFRAPRGCAKSATHLRKDIPVRRIVSRAVVSVVAGIALAATFPAASRGQDAATKGQPAAAEGPDRTPMSRFVPLENLMLYIECAGLEAHADAWQQTAAYKILNNTPTGAMLEEVLAQLIDQKLNKPAAPAAMPTPGPPTSMLASVSQTSLPPAFQKVKGAELVTMLKQMLNKGFVFAVNAPGPKTEASTVLVIRGAAKKGMSLPYAKVLGASRSPTSKIGKAVRAARNVIVVEDTDPKFTKDWGWWGEKDQDLVIAFDKAKSIDAIAATLDGKRPNASKNAMVTELTTAAGTFQPIVAGFLDFRALKAAPQSVGAPSPAITKFAENSGVDRIDFRWGLDGPAVTSITRLTAPTPRKKILASLETAPFAPRALPPIAKAAPGFTVATIDFKKAYDLCHDLLEQYQPTVSTQLDDFAARVKAKTRVRLKEDVLGRIGPKVAVYTMPTSSGPLSFGFQVPKGTLLAEVSDSVGLGKALDELVLMANRELKSAFAEPPPPAGDNGRATSGSGRRTAAAPEFRVSVGPTKSYVLYLPPAYSALTNLQLTVALGKKHIAISTSAAAAKEALALETQKDGAWKPSADLASAFERLPKSLLALHVSDPAESLPNGLVTLPAALEKALNLAIPNPALAANGPSGGDSSAGGQGMGVPGRGGSRPGGMSGPPGGGSSSRGGSGMFPPPGAMNGPVGGGSGMPASATGGSPGAGGSGGSPSSSGSAGDSQRATVTIKVDPSKIPEADAIKTYLFPGYAAVSSDAQAITLTTRSAFPSILASLIPDPTAQSLAPLLMGGGLSGLLKNPAPGAPAANAGQAPPGRAAPGRDRPPSSNSGRVVD